MQKQRVKTSMSVPEMGKMLGLGKVESYWLVKKNYFKTIQVAGRMRVMLDSFEDWYAGQFHYKKVDGTPPGEKWRHTTMSVPEMADLLGLKSGTAYDLVKRGYGDVVKIVNALRDYAKLLETVCDEWDLGGFHRATYEYQAEKLRQIADKFQCGIGYDYDAAVRKCQKLRGKRPRNADVGEEAMVLAVKRGFEQAQAKANKPSSPGQNDDKEVNRYE